MFRLATKLAQRHARGGQRNEAEIDIAEVIVHRRPYHSDWQAGGLFLHTLAYLVLQVKHLRFGGVVLELHLDVGLSLENRGIDPVEVLDLLDTLLQTVNHLGLQFIRCRSRPAYADNHGPYGESRVLGSTQLEERVHPCANSQDE
ncbi:hypothetical protein D9M68_761750 [compost metagenome]